MKKIIFSFILCFLIIPLISCDFFRKEKTFNGTQIFYTSSVTVNEVDILGAYLITGGFADGDKKTVQLNKSGNTYEFRMVVKKGIEQDPAYRELTKEFAIELSDYVFNGQKVDIHLCNDKLQTLFVIPMMGTGQNSSIGQYNYAVESIESYTDDILIFYATANLRLRREPDTTRDNRITAIQRGDRVVLLETGRIDTINDITAPWFMVMTEDGIVGWMFSGYLSHIKP